MINNEKNIILIGMPGSGKSTVGVILAKMMSRPFLDTDILIQLVEKRSLQDIIDQDGHMTLRDIEEKVLLDIKCANHVIATGGSAAYSSKAMNHLKESGIVCYLKTTLQTLQSRIKNYETRGLAKRPEQSLADLFLERGNLYASYADITLDNDLLTQEEMAEMCIHHCQAFLSDT